MALTADELNKLSPTEIIESTKSRAKIENNTQLAERMGLMRQTLAHKRKYPYTFTGGDIASLQKLLLWNAEETGAFVRGCKG